MNTDKYLEIAKDDKKLKEIGEIYEKIAIYKEGRSKPIMASKVMECALKLWELKQKDFKAELR